MSASAGTASAAGGIGGAPAVMSGADWRAALRAYGAFALLVAIIDTANVFSSVQDHAALGHPIAVIEPTIWEASSWIGFMLFAPIAYLASRLAPPRKGGWLRLVLVHPPASALFSTGHILSMWLVRIAVYAMGGYSYGGKPHFLYEYRKDIAAYIILVGLFWIARQLQHRALPQSPPAGALFDIKDGPRIIRAPVSDILAVCSAGNYVEVVLNDGRKPLMRSTLAAVEAELGPHGFLRTHRSWLVNAAHVRELAAVGSGDFTVTLDGGTEAPLSRRYPAALRSLRAPE